MHKIILLGVSNRWQIINALLILAVSVFNFMRSSSEQPVFHGLTLALMVASAILLIIMFLSSLKSSRLAVKVELNEENISFKTHFFGKPQQLKWQEIKNITFKPYQIIFQRVNDQVNVRYSTLARISVQVKEAIRELAAEKGISVTGG